MQRSGQLLTRATLIKDVWHYKFVPETNRVNVHMGRLHANVDGPHEAPIIRNVRGEDALSETPGTFQQRTSTAGAQAERADSNEF